MVNNFGVLSIIPPLIAIALALITKEVISSLLIGILSGAFIFASFNPLATVETTFALMTGEMGGNASMILFLSLLGALVAVVTLAGGSEAYGKWASTKIKSPRGAKLATTGLSLLLFIDDYFNCLTTGAVMRPVTDKNGVSRAKLAHLVDSTAAPICIMAPISSWAASIIAIIAATGVTDDPLGMFVSSIPFNFYALLTVGTVIFFSLYGKEIGPMADPKLLETSINQEADLSREFEVSPKGRVFDLVIPILTLIVVTILSMLYTGGFFEGGMTIGEGFGNASVNTSLIWGAFAGLVVAFFMYVPRKLATIATFMNAVTAGIKSMIPAIIILTLAWSIGGICGEDYLNTGGFVGDLMKNSNISYGFLPAIIFVVGAILSFSTGTAWGTFGILVPILVPIVIAIGEVGMLPIVLGAIFSGSVFGDHCSPISDTTILSSAGTGCKHIVHVATQIPYAMIAAIAAFVGFLVGGFSNNAIISLIVGIATLAALIFVARKITDRKSVATAK